ncbi:hypothetical protein ACSYAD_22905 [Acaryochloris marina NIES-2412]
MNIANNSTPVQVLDPLIEQIALVLTTELTGHVKPDFCMWSA